MVVSPELEYAPVCRPAASGPGTGFPPSCQSAIATKTPAKPLATSFKPNKHAPTNHDAAERRVGRYRGSANW